MRIDLHCHSSVSDGTRAPAEMMRRARAAGLDVVALTDHDTQAGHDEARRALPPGLTLVPGMELSCRLDGHSVHMLAYYASPAHPALAAECAAIVTDRVRRGQAMVERLRALGVGISWEQAPSRARDGGGRRHRAPSGRVYPGVDRRRRPGLCEQIRTRPGAGD
jgi:predicted metal-dependent phosphoesterase TrpH